MTAVGVAIVLFPPTTPLLVISGALAGFPVRGRSRVLGGLLLLFTFLFGREIYGARLWIYVGPIGIQPGEFIKIVLVVFIAGYLEENRALLTGASARIGPISIPPLPYLLPMLAIFVMVMLMVVILRDLGTALLFFGIFLTMLFVATGRRSYVLIGLVLVTIPWMARNYTEHGSFSGLDRAVSHAEINGSFRAT